MYLKNLLKTMLGILILSSCKPSGYDYFTFDPRILKENEITLSDIADDVTYLPLPNNFPVSKASNFYFTDQLIYLYSVDGIIAFDRTENQLRKIGSKGRGPGEYLFSSNFSVDTETGKVYVLDQGDDVKTYSKTGEFLKSIPLKRFGESTSIDFFESALFVTYAFQFGASLYAWAIFDTSGQVIKKEKLGSRHLAAYLEHPGQLINMETEFIIGIITLILYFQCYLVYQLNHPFLLVPGNTGSQGQEIYL